MLREKQLQALADIVGEDHFSAEEYMRKLYSHDVGALPGLVDDILKTKADAVAQPMSSEIVSNLLKFCRKNKIPVVPRGHGTSGYGGALPTKAGVSIEMTRMNAIYDIDHDTMTIEVGAGIIWSKLLEDLEDEGLTVRAYPSSAPSSTVGGWVAAGGTGIGSTKYGGVKEQVVDLEVVLPDGQIIRSANPPQEFLDSIEDHDYKYLANEDEYLWAIGKISKDINDITDLFVDSNGTLGVITKVVLRVIPLQTIRPLVASFERKEQMVWAMQDLMKKTKPFYLHFITDGFFGMLKEVGMAPESTHPWLILCAFEGSQSSIAEEEKLFKEAIGDNFGVVESDHLGEHEWAERFYPMRIKRLGPSLAPSEVYVPLKNIVSFIERCDKHFKGESFALEGAVTDTGEVAVLAWFLDDERKTISFLMGWYRSLDFIEMGLKDGGRAYSIGMWNVAHSRSFYGKQELARMASIKRKTDPKRYMNPTKVFPGPLQLSFRFNLLILIVAAIAVPVVLWIANILIGDLLSQYISWLLVTDVQSAILAFGIGLIIGVAAIEVVNWVPITFMLTMGRPFLRLGRKIFH
ncbi:MAG: FAD-binding oxidoreductase [Candidatus Thorarchaeota archaeon]|nr:FAD-binding oxidoreductase [Candidatus Thorarchaeota archaeon]MCK5238972.1 FAD-binding oxidoreductase [Candidatus Thorarchaeota archaeon]